MANLELISKDTHSDKYWKRPTDFQFTRQDSFCPITLMEVPAAATSLPICFLANEKGFQLGLLLGLNPNCSFAIDAAGNWLFDYIPGYYRAYPFALARDGNSKLSLCFQINSGLISENASDEAFFTAEGMPTDTVKSMLDFLSSLTTSETKTVEICANLNELGLIEPWPISIEDGDRTKNIEGVFRVSEDAFSKISAEEFLKLRASDALILIYGQLFSMQNLSRLSKYFRAHNPTENALPAELDLDGNFIQNSGNISFNHL